MIDYNDLSTFSQNLILSCNVPLSTPPTIHVVKTWTADVVDAVFTSHIVIISSHPSARDGGSYD